MEVVRPSLNLRVFQTEVNLWVLFQTQEVILNLIRYVIRTEVMADLNLWVFQTRKVILNLYVFRTTKVVRNLNLLVFQTREIQDLNL